MGLAQLLGTGGEAPLFWGRMGAKMTHATHWFCPDGCAFQLSLADSNPAAAQPQPPTFLREIREDGCSPELPHGRDTRRASCPAAGGHPLGPTEAWRGARGGGPAAGPGAVWPASWPAVSPAAWTRRRAPAGLGRQAAARSGPTARHLMRPVPFSRV